MKRISFYTFGCRLNQSETASIEHSFKKNGYMVVGFDEPADIVVVNTCTVTEGGDADTRHLVQKINRHHPHARIALVGCQAQVQKDKLADLPNVRWVVGNERKMDLAAVLSEYPEQQVAHVVTPTIDRKAFKVPFASIVGSHTRANIKIQDGCDFFCSFCEIPYARGRARSRVFEDILLEAHALVEAGHKEIVLTGINIGTYENQGKGLLDVITSLEAIEGLSRIRISSIEPTTLTHDIFDLMQKGRKLCPYLHLPLQSGDDEVLAEMKRKYKVQEFVDFVKEAKKNVPLLCVGTDVIVGFPVETRVHFNRTVELLKEIPVDYFHVFSYSPRTMAHSRLLHNVPPQEIQYRSQVLRNLSLRKRAVFNESLIGSVQDVLFEKPKGDGFQNGLTANFVRVKVFESEDLFNKVLPVYLDSVKEGFVVGHIVSLAASDRVMK